MCCRCPAPQFVSVLFLFLPWWQMCLGPSVLPYSAVNRTKTYGTGQMGHFYNPISVHLFLSLGFVECSLQLQPLYHHQFHPSYHPVYPHYPILILKPFCMFFLLSLPQHSNTTLPLAASENAGLQRATQVMNCKKTASVLVLHELGEHLCSSRHTQMQRFILQWRSALAQRQLKLLLGSHRKQLMYCSFQTFTPYSRKTKIFQDLNYHRMLKYMFIMSVREFVLQNYGYSRAEGGS